VVVGNSGQQDFKIKRSGEKIIETAEATNVAAFKKPRIYAVIVGVSKYKNSQFNLNYADSDAKLIYDFLKSPNGGGVPDDQIKLVLNDDATRANIVKNIQKIFKDSDKEDLIFFYFAGHGVAEGQSMYFLSSEAELDNLIGTAVSQEDIEKSIKVARAKKAIMVLDACHAGATVISFGGSRDVDVRNRIALEIAQASDGLGLITAAGPNQLSKEDPKWGGGHGAFTWFFIEGLKGPADTDGDKIITLREAYKYAQKKVEEATGGKQSPEHNGNLDLPLGAIK